MPLRYEDKAVAGLSALFADATGGINTRCSATNASVSAVVGSPKFALPTVWVSQATQQIQGHIQTPFYEIYSTGIRREEPPAHPGTSVFLIDGEVRAWMAPADTAFDNVKSSRLYRMLSWTLLEMVTERDSGLGGRWDGNTLLGNVQAVYDPRVVPGTRLPQTFAANEAGGAIGAILTVTIEVAEDDTA